jgi:hypothetical protein
LQHHTPRGFSNEIEWFLSTICCSVIFQPNFQTHRTLAAVRISAAELAAVPTSTRSFTQLLSAEAGVNTDLSSVLTKGNGNQPPSSFYLPFSPRSP